MTMAHHIRTPREPERPPQDIDDLIFMGETDPGISDR